MCNLFNIEAIKKASTKELSYHIAFKKSNYLDKNGNLIEPEEPNAYKFEQFIFDSFKLFDNISILRGKREEDFAPVKNKEGKRQSYAIKEAEMVIIDYVSGIEEKRKNINLRNNKVNKKYKRLKIYSIATTALFLLETITFVIVK